LDAVGAKRALVLAKQTALGIFHDVEEIIGVEIFTHNAHRQPADKFRLEAVLDEILCRDVLEQFVVHHLNWLGSKPYLCLPDPTRHLLLQLFERAADDKENMAGVDCLAFCFAAPLEFEIGRAHVCTPVTWPSRMPSSA